MITTPLWLLHGTILLALVIGSITDLKKREVPDTLNYGLMGVGVVSGIILSILNHSIWPSLSAISGLFMGYLIGALMYYTGQWGGGDAKMLMGIGAMQGLFIPVVSVSAFGELFSGAPIFITTIFTIFVAGAIYGILYTMYLALTHWKVFKHAFTKKIREPKIVKRRYLITGSVVGGLILIFIIPETFFKISIGLIVFTVFFGHYLMLIGKIVEEQLMITSMHVSKITEGEWIKKEVKIKGNIICGPKDKLGISTKQIAELKKHGVKTVTIKQGVPFIPGFLLGYIIIMFVGNWVNYLIIF
ncbi:A24 family peptidase [Candidatus Woesearchaeota archaeon]|nr:A24 family peptidase [Candidatus Woesearchaeota archaeon]